MRQNSNTVIPSQHGRRSHRVMKREPPRKKKVSEVSAVKPTNLVDVDSTSSGLGPKTPEIWSFFQDMCGALCHLYPRRHVSPSFIVDSYGFRIPVGPIGPTGVFMAIPPPPLPNEEVQRSTINYVEDPYLSSDHEETDEELYSSSDEEGSGEDYDE